jgi:hypothetical protein
VGVALYTGYVEDIADPIRNGRLRITIPEFTGNNSVSDWIQVAHPFGQKGSISKGEQVAVLITEAGIPGHYEALILGQISAAPAGKGSLAPLAIEGAAIGGASPTEYAKLSIVEVDPAQSEKWLVKVKGKFTSILIDSVSNQITIDSGDDNLIVLAPATQGDARVALEGDVVSGRTSDGALFRGTIESGSAPMVALNLT